MIEGRVVLGKEKIRENTDEIPVFQEMFEYLKTKGNTIISDAMHCQKIYEREIEKATEETSYYISNSKVPTKKSLAILRKHWKIESMIMDIDLFLVFKFMK